MLAHLALAAALFMAAGHLAPQLPDSPGGAVILTAPDTKVREPHRCPPVSDPPLYRDLSGTTLIPAVPLVQPANPGSPP